jgi:hypothetical protein
MVKVEVGEEWYRDALETLQGRHGCPHCRSSREPIVRAADETFEQQLGCLDCGKWFSKPELRGSR